MSTRIPPGAIWRIKHEAPPSRRGKLTFGSTSHDLVSADYPESHMGPGSKHARFPMRTILDEVVIGGPDGCWLHLEQMSRATWFLGIGEDKVMITVDKYGKPKMGEWYK